MTDPTIIQQYAQQLYDNIKKETRDASSFINKPNAFLFCTILTKAATCVEEYKSNGRNLSSAEKQIIVIEIGRLWITDLKGPNSSELTEYNLVAVPMVDLLVGFSNDLVIIAEKAEKEFFGSSCFKKCFKRT